MMWVFLLFLAMPLIEIGLFVEIGGRIGLWATLFWVLGAAFLGVLLLRRIAQRGAVALHRDLSAFGNPVGPVAHQSMLVVAAMLLILPGFLSDALGLVLLLKPVRTALIGLVARRLKIVPVGTASARTTEAEVIEGEWQEVDGEVPPRRGPPSGWTQH
jgi:UPF0716 protein FxsA